MRSERIWTTRSDDGGDGDGVKGRAGRQGRFPFCFLAAQLYLLGGFGKGSSAMPVFVDGVPFMAHLLLLVPV